MAKKKVGVWMEEAIASRLDRLVGEGRDAYGVKGDVVSAAVYMFLQADMAKRRQALQAIGSRAIKHLGLTGPDAEWEREQIGESVEETGRAESSRADKRHRRSGDAS